MARFSGSYHGVCTTAIAKELSLTLRRHPASVEAMVALTQDIVATGSEDGMIRVMQVHPNKFRKSGVQFDDVSSPPHSWCHRDTRRLPHRAYAP